MNIQINSPLFITLISTGVVFVIAGFFMKKFPPKKINYLYGYRTPGSMRSQKHWDFSQIYSAKLMIKLGLIMQMISLFGIFLGQHPIAETILALVIVFYCIFHLIYRTEKELSKLSKKD